MEPAALRRARVLRAWATCAPRFVRGELEGILRCAALSEANRQRLEHLLVDLELGEPGTWFCRFPALAGPSAPEGMEGGLLSVVATDAGVLPPRGARAAKDTLEAGGVARAGNLHVAGLPNVDATLVVGRSGAAAEWLADRARATGRKVPPDVVVSAALEAGADGEPRLAMVAGGGAKARVVATEMPGARLLLCGDAEGEDVVSLPAGARIRELERLVWGGTALVDRTELQRMAAVADDAFRAHAYATAASRYHQLLTLAGDLDGELRYEACIRLAAIAVHGGRGPEAEAWYRRADEVPIPETRRKFRVERLTGLAGAAIDAFRPAAARSFLEDRRAQRALDDPDELWERIQALGAWRRLHLLEGQPKEARAVQRSLVAAADEIERPRSLLDLGFVELRCGDLAAAARALVAARAVIPGMAPVYRVQSEAFLTWHVARLARAGGPVEGLHDLLLEDALDTLLSESHLQEAGRWRVRAIRAALARNGASIPALVADLLPFQRWYLGVFLLGDAEWREVGARALATSDVDLSGMPVLEHAREELRRGRLDPTPFLQHSAY
jgi:hypothetical protein